VKVCLLAYTNNFLTIIILMQNKNIHINCKDCGINTICLPSMLVEAEVAHLDSIIQRKAPAINKGSHLFNSGDPFKYVYAIRAGAFKTYVNSYTGEEQIIAFHLPGELIGLDAINSKIHNSSSVALMPSQICQIPYDRLDELSAEIKGLRNQIMKLLSKEITENQALLLLLGQKKSKERMAALLVNLSSRYAARNLPSDLITLPMSRSEMANYLGMTIETVSRILKEFKEKEFIQINGKQVFLKNITSLKHIAGVFCQ
jgi:CRP/FNR family transcriptional regulator